MEEAPLEAIPALGPQKRPVNKRFVYLVLAILVLLVAFFTYRIFGAKESGTISQSPAAVTPAPTEELISPTASEEQISTSPTLTTTPTPIPTLNPVDNASGLDRSKLSVTVQNGSGEAGVAGKGAATLKHLGYNVAGTGNADNFDYSNVVIQIKSASNDFLSLLKDDLGLSYTIGSTSADLPDSFSSDALVIIGK
jgi:hypothetical protein